jgi:hypothetical protein
LRRKHAQTLELARVGHIRALHGDCAPGCRYLRNERVETGLAASGTDDVRTLAREGETYCAADAFSGTRDDAGLPFEREHRASLLIGKKKLPRL